MESSDVAESYGYSREFQDYMKNIPIKAEQGSASGRALVEGRVVHITETPPTRPPLGPQPVQGGVDLGRGELAFGEGQHPVVLSGRGQGRREPLTPAASDRGPAEQREGHVAADRRRDLGQPLRRQAGRPQLVGGDQGRRVVSGPKKEACSVRIITPRIRCVRSIPRARRLTST